VGKRKGEKKGEEGKEDTKDEISTPTIAVKYSHEMRTRLTGWRE